MKFKSFIITTCIATSAMLHQSLAQEVATPTPGAPPKFGPEKSGPGNGGRGEPGDRGRKGRPSPEERLKKMTEALALTPDQVTKIRQIFKNEAEKMRAEYKANKGAAPDQSGRKAKMGAARAEVDAAVKAVLTPEQQTKWETVKKNRKEHGEHGPGDAPKCPMPPAPTASPSPAA